LRAALSRLGIRRLALAVHDASFPAGPDDLGRGTPYGRSAATFFDFLAGLGFDAVQLGPQGKVSLANPSPYDGAVMARSHLSVSLGPLVDEPGLGGLLRPEELAALVADVPVASRQRAQQQEAWRRTAEALTIAQRRFAATPKAFAALAQAAPGFFARQEDWL
jgi:hypothetical protein